MSKWNGVFEADGLSLNALVSATNEPSQLSSHFPLFALYDLADTSHTIRCWIIVLRGASDEQVEWCVRGRRPLIECTRVCYQRALSTLDRFPIVRSIRFG